MKNSLFRYLCLAVALVSCNLAGAQQKANYQLAEKFRLLEQNPIDKYSTEVRPTFINDTDCFYYSFTTREGKKYYYKVRAIKKAGKKVTYSKYSKAVSVKIKK